jgi:Zn-dependent protease with chaperone function
VATQRSSSPALRAALALALLAGVYLLGIGIVVGLVAANVLVIGNGHIYVQLLAVSAVATFAITRGLFFVDRSSRTAGEGTLVDAQSQPELVAAVRDVAAQMQTRPPDEVRISADVNAYVRESGGLLGLRRGRRVLVVGLGLVEAVDADELRGVLAHEMGHYAGGHTALGPVTYRTAESLRRIVVRTQGSGVLHAIFVRYYRLFMRLTQSMRRAMELEADAAAARIAGRDAFVSGLRRVETSARAFGFFLENYVSPQWRMGYAPDNLFTGYRNLLTDATRVAEMEGVRAALEKQATDRWDSHPSLAERVAAVQKLPASGHPRDDRPARRLLRDADAVEATVGMQFSQLASGGRAVTPMPWDQVADRVYAQGSRQWADKVLLGMRQIAGFSHEPSLWRVFDLVAAGRGRELATILAGADLQRIPTAQRVEALDEIAGSALRAVMLQHLAATVVGARWVVNWGGAVQLRGPDGTELAPRDVVQAAVRDTSLLPALRESVERAA